jgi:tRNA (cytidine32/uridine32-2'-O)-methyltransferase
MSGNSDDARADAMLRRVRIVLVGTLHSGNIGAAARAMKTMGLTRLYLAAPADFPHREATYRAVQAVDVLEQAIVTKDMAEAVADCTLVIGTSARQRRIQLPQLHPRELGVLCAGSARDEIAIVFGREDSGLSNEEMQRCNWQVHIPTSEAYTSMNLAAVVQVLCYELRMAALGNAQPNEGGWDEPLASAEGMERFYDHLESTLTEIDFLKPTAPRQLMTRLRRLFNRIRLDQMELNILRGWLTATQKAARGELDSDRTE